MGTIINTHQAADLLSIDYYLFVYHVKVGNFPPPRFKSGRFKFWLLEDIPGMSATHNLIKRTRKPKEKSDETEF